MTKKNYLTLLLILCIFPLNSLFAQKESKIARIGFYNLENLFDTVDGENNDADFLPDGIKHWTKERYMMKLQNMAEVISTLADGHAPDILGVCEIENKQVLEDLVQQEAIKKYNYQIVHFNSPDKRGIDCGLIYQANKFFFTNASSHFVKLKGEEHILTRDILEVNGILLDEAVSILVGHWPSRSGGEAASMPRRMAAAQVMRQVTDRLLAERASQKVILMGDFNDDPTSPSVVDGLKCKNKASEVQGRTLFNVMAKLYTDGYGTLAYRDTWNLFDNIVVTGNLLNDKTNRWVLQQDQRTKAYGYITQNPKLIQKTGHYKGYPFRTFSGDTFQNGYSDHFPVYIILKKK